MSLSMHIFLPTNVELSMSLLLAHSILSQLQAPQSALQLDLQWSG